MIRKNHYYFVLPLRPWPLLCSIQSFNLLFSLLIFFKFINSLSFIFRLIRISFISMCWWCFYRGEINLEGINSLNLELGIKLAIILFISSEVFFFFSFFWSYFHFFLGPEIELGLSWPPVSVLSFDCLNVPLINTLILIASGVSVTLRHNFILKNKYKSFMFFLFITICIGILFSLLQLIEYKTSFFSIGDRSFGTIFFVLTGFHGIHVILGSIFLLTTMVRSFKFCRSNQSFARFELASWYWHFVDVVWIFLYFFLYYINQ